MNKNEGTGKHIIGSGSEIESPNLERLRRNNRLRVGYLRDASLSVVESWQIKLHSVSAEEKKLSNDPNKNEDELKVVREEMNLLSDYIQHLFYFLETDEDLDCTESDTERDEALRKLEKARQNRDDIYAKLSDFYHQHPERQVKEPDKKTE